MANTFEEQARDRFGKAKAFLSKAQTLLQDDLVARTVLADAVSAIKNAMQGYLLVRVGQLPNHPEAQRWQEVAASNRMPDLIGACIDAGLEIRPLARDIRRLNDERNYRTHDDPLRRIDAEQARSALELARGVAQRVNASVKGQRAVEIPASVAASAPARVPLHNGGSAGYAAPAARQAPVAVATATREAPTPATNTGVAAAAATVSRAPAAEESAAALVAEDDEAPATDDTGIFIALSPRRHGARWPIARGAIAAALLGGGLAAGIALAIPLAHSTPGWLSFARSWYAVNRTAVVTRQAAATPLAATTASLSAGNLLVSAPICRAGKASIQLRNAGRAPLSWAMGGARSGEAATFATTPSAAPQPSALGTLAPSAATTVFASVSTKGPYPLVIVAPGGTVPLVAPAC